MEAHRVRWGGRGGGSGRGWEAEADVELHVGRGDEVKAAALHDVDARAADVRGVPGAQVTERENGGEHEDEEAEAVLKSMTVMVGACWG